MTSQNFPIPLHPISDHSNPMQQSIRISSFSPTLHSKPSTPVRSRSNASPSFPSPSHSHSSAPLLRPVISPPSVPLHPSARRSITMSLAAANAAASDGDPTLAELNGVEDFESVASPDGSVSICGFGSLLSERSARSTFPELKNFRVAQLSGFRRVFAHVAPIFFERGIANAETGEISSLSVEPCEGEFLIVTVFEIKIEEVPSFLKREEEFRFLAVFPEGLDGVPFPSRAVLCARYSDEEYFQVRCQGSKEIYHERYGRYNIHKIWRDDILPCRLYLRHCVLAAKNLGEAVYSNFLDHTYLSDRKTTIRQYLATTGAGIMEEEPPESLRSRYGG